MTMTTDQILGILFSRIEAIDQATSATRGAMPAVTQAVQRLADGLSASEKRHIGVDTTLSGVQGALTLLVASVDKIRDQRDPLMMTAEEIAKYVSFDTLCEARRIVWTRSHPDSGWDVADPGTVDKKGRVKGVVGPRPLPPTPFDIVPDHVKKKRAGDNDEYFKRVVAEKRLRLTIYFSCALLILITLLAIFVWRH